MKKVILFSKLLYLNVFAKPTIKTTYCKCCYNKEIDPQSILDDMNNNNNNGNNNTNIDNNNDNLNNNDNNNNIDNNDKNKDDNGNNIEDKKDYKEDNEDNNKEDNIYSDNANLDGISYISDSEEIECLDQKETVAKDNNNDNNNNNDNIDNKDDEINKIIEYINEVIACSIAIIKKINKFNILKNTKDYITDKKLYLFENIDKFHTDINAILDSIKNIYKIDNNEIKQLKNLIKLFENLKNNSLGLHNQNIENLNNILLEIKNNNDFYNNLKNECNNLLELIKKYEEDKLNKFILLYKYFTEHNYKSEIKDINEFINILNEKNDSFKKNIGDILNKYKNIKKNNIILINKLDINETKIKELEEYKDKNTNIDENTLNNPDNFNYYQNIYNYYNELTNTINLKSIPFKNIAFDSANDNMKTYFNKCINKQNNNQYLFAVKNIKKCINNNNNNIDCNNLFLFIYKTFKDKKIYYRNHLFKYTNEGYLHVDSFNNTSKRKNKKEENFLLKENENWYGNWNGTEYNIELYDINLIDKVKSYFENKYNLENKKKSSNKHMKSKTTNLKKNNK